MSDDLVKRLRDAPPCNGCGEYPGQVVAEIMGEAADRIRELEAQVGRVTVKPLECPESGDFAQLVVPAIFRPCAHGGGWWETEDVDGRKVLLGIETPCLSPAPVTVSEAARVLLDADMKPVRESIAISFDGRDRAAVLATFRQALRAIQENDHDSYV